MSFDQDLAQQVRAWLSDVRRFVPVNIGFDWLMKLANSDNSEARQFAIDRINKGFLPADFAPQASAPVEIVTTTDTNKPDITVDLAQQSFCLLGKCKA